MVVKIIRIIENYEHPSIEFCFVTFIKTLEVCDISRKMMLTTKEREYSLNALLYPSN